MNWPSTTDPWNLANPTDNSLRRSYYGFNGIPIVAVEGDTMHSYLASNWTAIRNFTTQRLAIPSHIWLSLQGRVTPAGDSLYVTARIVADSAIGAGNKLYIAVTSYANHLATPSPNGLSDFFNNMYKMYPNGSGGDFTHSGNTADTTTVVAPFQLRLTGAVPMLPENIRLTAWVQTTAGRDVLQSESIVLTPMMFPHGGDTLYVDVPATVRWAPDAYSGNVNLELNRDYPTGTWETILTNVPDSGSAVITLTGAATDNARFRMTQTDDPTRSDTMRSNFKIQLSTTLAAQTNPVNGTVLVGDTLVSSVVINNTGTENAHVVLTPHTGSDNYGVRQSTDENGPPYEWVNLTGLGVAGPTGDDASTAFTLPWAFPYYGRTYTTIYMCTNGWLSFSNITYSNYLAGNTSLPASGSSGPLNTLLAVFWDDLLVQAGTGSCRIWSDTTNHRVIFGWIQTQRYNDAATRINAQAMLYQDGRIVFQYGTLSGTINSATVGLQNFNGSLFTQVWTDGVSIPASRAVALDAQRIWARPLTTVLSIPAGGTYTVNFYWDGRGTNHDSVYTGSWDFVGNVVPFSLPFTLHVDTVESAAGNAPVPLSFSVGEAYPNPFNPTTCIDLMLDKTTNVRMAVFDVLGRQVATLIDGKLEAGSHRQIIEAGNWATGLYFVKVTAGGHQYIRKLMLLK